MRKTELIYTQNVMHLIRRCRREKDYSQEYMAIRLDISQNAYSKLESGKTPLTIDRLIAICEILMLKPEDLLTICGISIDAMNERTQFR